MKLPRFYPSMTTDERREARSEYSRLQGGDCWYCGHSLSEDSPLESCAVNVRWHRFPKNFLTWPVHLHHDHDTGLTIGAVHAYCNAVSFDYEESP